jgi:hypothetical protein
MGDKTEEDDQITLNSVSEEGEKEASAGKTMFDKTSYSEEDKTSNPLDVSPDKFKKKCSCRSRRCSDKE